MKIEYTPVRELRPYPNNARTHSKKQIRQIARSIERFGFCNPVLVDDAKQIIAGHGRVEAAKLLGINAVPIRWRLRGCRRRCCGNGIEQQHALRVAGTDTLICRRVAARLFGCPFTTALS
jgi:ParB/Sulfiredoxin domain